jgi:predicted nucleic acid-binding protein
MERESLYLDTSVPSAYYDKRAKERMEATIKFWQEVLPHYKIYVSEITVKEFEDTKDEGLRRKFRELIKGFKVLKEKKAIKNLARAYIEKEIIPEKYIDDALHVAVASYYEISYLVSWNYEHLVKVKTRRLVNSVNILEGFKEIEIVSPLEL